MKTTVFPTAAEANEILVGPDSVAWQRVSDVRLNLVIVYALLLQVAHPTVGAAVRDHSDFEDRPWERLIRTAGYTTTLVYGGPDAIVAGRRVRQLHTRFKGRRKDGRPYHALEPAAYAWVHATMINSYVTGHAHFGSPMSRAEVEQFYREYRGLGRLVGVRECDLPPTWSAFCEYFERIANDELAHTESVDRVLRAIRRVPPPPLPLPELLWRTVRMPAADVLRLCALGPMSPQLRKRLGISWNPLDEVRFRGLALACRSLTPVLPGRLKVTARW